MYSKSQKAIIISASSDIGSAICRRWVSNGWKIFGTYRTKSGNLIELGEDGVKLIHCDIQDNKSVNQACSKLQDSCPKWDVLLLCSGSQNPIGPFMENDFNQWEDSLNINFSSQLRMVHKLLPFRNTANDLGPCVIFFAGGGVNNATINYSAYTISKIALIKMCELLDAEIPDVRFVIIGPGWVKTKIHDATFKAGKLAGESYELTKKKLAGKECTPIEKILDCCDWLVRSPREVISGRNFSVVFDNWGLRNCRKNF